LKQADVDGEAFRMFCRYRLDFEGTVKRMLARNVEQIATLERLVADAQRALATAQENRARVRGDYEGGRLSAEAWDESRPGLAEREQAAEAEHARLSDQLAKLRAIPGEAAEAAVYKRLQELADGIGGDVRNAAQQVDTPALRAAINSTFEKVVPTSRQEVRGSSRRVFLSLVPVPRPEVVQRGCTDRRAWEKAPLDLGDNPPLTTITGKLATFHHQ
jgi:hypothetical protein